ncbi:hypothetical protein ACOSQ4_012737 [Xanthoceras sorbifolium]
MSFKIIFKEYSQVNSIKSYEKYVYTNLDTSFPTVSFLNFSFSFVPPLFLFFLPFFFLSSSSFSLLLLLLPLSLSSFLSFLSFLFFFLFLSFSFLFSPGLFLFSGCFFVKLPPPTYFFYKISVIATYCRATWSRCSLKRFHHFHRDQPSWYLVATLVAMLTAQIRYFRRELLSAICSRRD